MTGLDFRSDNSGCAAPEFIAAMAAANTGCALGYGGDELTAILQTRYSEVFEKPVRVYPVPTGTLANAVSLAAASGPFGAVYCSGQAHINTAECNATGFFGGGTKLVAVDGEHGKLDPQALAAALSRAARGMAYSNQPTAINLVQATDLGAVHNLQEIAEIGGIARANQLKLHMDGARFTNALVHLGCTPAELTWRSGVDILSFGVTKNGGLLADAIVVFDDDTARDIGFHLRRAGAVWSKMRFASAQLLAAVEDDLWRRLARQANEAALRLAGRLAAIEGVSLLAPVQANQVFMVSTPDMLVRLQQADVRFLPWGDGVARFVCRWDTRHEEVDALADLMARLTRRHALANGPGGRSASE